MPTRCSKPGVLTLRSRKIERLLGVDKRRLVGINMKLLSLNRGAVHGYRYDERSACHARRAFPLNGAFGDLTHPC